MSERQRGTGGTHTPAAEREREGEERWGGLTAIHRLHFGHVPCPDGAVLARALPVRDILTSVHAGAVARLPGAVGTGRAVRVTIRSRRKAPPTRSDAPEHAASAGRAAPLQLRPGLRRKRRLRVA